MLGDNLGGHQSLHSRAASEMDEDGGLELTGNMGNNNGVGGDYVHQESPRSKHEDLYKKGIAIATAVIAAIALLLALIAILVILPALLADNQVSNTSSTAADSANLGDNGLSGDLLSNETASPTMEPSASPTYNIEPIHIYNETTEYYNCSCECNTSTYGLLNAGLTYKVGGYHGWSWYDANSYPDLYPLADIHASIGDKIFFTHRGWTRDDLWLVTEDVYESCDFADTTMLQQLSTSNGIRGDQENNPSYPGGYEFLIQDWHLREYGEILYFSSATYWADFTDSSSCIKGVKVRVFIEEREAIPVSTDGKGFDISATDTVQDLQYAIGQLSRMLILSQFSTEQRVRSEGDSGLTNVRGHYDGNAAYDDGTYTNGAVASIHDHADNLIVVGIGEIQAVLNGVEFQTRHNDYNLNQPHHNSTEYGATEPIEYPAVPPEVLNAGNVAAQTAEMIEWFRAFKTQNKSHRNYTEYFKPILCYLEGTWILDDDTLTEPFDSDRHAIDAKSWKQLHDKIRWMANSGRKNSAENLAHLPSSIRNLVNDTYPIVSNWEYRILCHQLKNDIPTERFVISNDLSVQLMGSPETREELKYDRRARFEINKYIDVSDPDNNHQWTAGRKRWNYLDYLMEQIPGKDNYAANISDALPDGSEEVIHYETDEVVNSGYYSRFYGLLGEDAMGSSKHRRSWSDRYLFAAKTTQPKVSPVEFDFELEDDWGNVEYYPTVSRWSYAIPLEIIYQTPLTRWNPHNINFVEDRNDFDYNRGGTCTTADAFDGYTWNVAYFTPAAFFEGNSEVGAGDTADTNVCALDSNGVPQPVYASGHWITFPEIANDVGFVRQRYPIFPIHNGGSAAFKEVKALQDVVLPDDYDDPIANPDGFFGDSRDAIYGFELSLMGGGHQHICYLPSWRIRYYWQYDEDTNSWCTTSDCVVTADCETRNGHPHTIRVWRDYEADGQTWRYHILGCRFGSYSDEDQYTEADWMDLQCADNHNSLQR